MHKPRDTQANIVGRCRQRRVSDTEARQPSAKNFEKKKEY